MNRCHYCGHKPSGCNCGAAVAHNGVEHLLKAALEAHKLLATVVPDGSYGSPLTSRYKKQVERINRVFSMLDDAIDDMKGLP